MRAPEFWQDAGPSWPARLLAPLGELYGTVTILRRWYRTPYRPGVKVVVAGGLTLGGAGKTPLALALGEKLRDRGVHFVSRGYGGRLAGPVRVDPTRHAASEVGDEPLLLAGAGPTWVARDRAAGARAAVAAGAGLLILDDGFQNPTIAKDLAFLAVDGTSGIGNGRVFPAGPLREPAAAALARASAVVLIGEDRTGIARLVGQRCPVLGARLEPTAEAASLAGQRVLAFCGLARPEKFFASLRAVGAEIAQARTFPDHHPYSAKEAAALIDEAARLGALPVTTAKDHVRLPADLRPRTQVFAVTLVFEDPTRFDELLSLLDRPTVSRSPQ